MRWKLGETLHLMGDIETEARAEQEAHREVSIKEGMIFDYLDKPVPEDWQKWDLNQRRTFLNGLSLGDSGDVKLARRNRICALEVWCELFNGSPKDFRYSDAAEINEIIRSTPGWIKTSSGLRFGYCGYQRGFQRVSQEE